LTHGKEVNARQRALPCGAGKTHGKESVAGQYIAVRSLPCVDARQSLCLAFFPLCRAFCPHGKALFSGSVGNLHINQYDRSYSQN
jgi:hypothetical protein